MPESRTQPASYPGQERFVADPDVVSVAAIDAIEAVTKHDVIARSEAHV